jgi:hypothetical protein
MLLIPQLDKALGTKKILKEIKKQKGCEIKVHLQQLRHEAIKGPRSRKFHVREPQII